MDRRPPRIEELGRRVQDGSSQPGTPGGSPPASLRSLQTRPPPGAAAQQRRPESNAPSVAGSQRSAAPRLPPAGAAPAPQPVPTMSPPTFGSQRSLLAFRRPDGTRPPVSIGSATPRSGARTPIQADGALDATAVRAGTAAAVAAAEGSPGGEDAGRYEHGLEDQIVSIRCHDQARYWSSTRPRLLAVRTRVSDTEKFHLHYNEDMTVSLMPLDQHKVVCVGINGDLEQEEPEIAQRWALELVYHDDNTCSLRFGGLYVTVKEKSGNLCATEETIGPAEKFEIRHIAASGEAENPVEDSIVENTGDGAALRRGALLLCPVPQPKGYVRGYVVGMDQNGYLVAELALEGARELLPSGYHARFGHLWRGHERDCRPGNSAKMLLEDDHDLSKLSIVSEEAIVDALRHRWQRGMRYCSVRSSVVVLTDTEPTAAAAAAEAAAASPPWREGPLHDLCARSLRAVEVFGRRSLIVLQGESGSGKTTAVRHVLQFFVGTKPGDSAAAAAAPAGAAAAAGIDVGTRLRGPVRELLDAFAGARTHANQNSHRVGALWQLWPKLGGGLEGARLTACALEVARVVAPDQRERNFNVFYQLFDLGLEERKELGLLARPDAYRYLQDSLVWDREQRFVGDGFERLSGALSALGLPYAAILDVCRTLAGILACGNVGWTGSADSVDSPGTTRGTSATFDERRRQRIRELEPVATAFGVDVQALVESLGADVFLHAESDALERRLDEVACGVYGRLFSWLVGLANESLKSVSAAARSVAVLDICGFESLPGGGNSLDQLVYNHASDLLYRGMLQDGSFSLFKTAGFDEHGLIQDNAAVVELIQGGASGTPPGILELLERPSATAGGAPVDFAAVVFRAFVPHSHLAPIRGGDRRSTNSPGGGGSDGRSQSLAGFSNSSSQGGTTRCFSIAHTARPVEYDVSGFRQRDRTGNLGSGLVALLAKSRNDAVRSAFAAEAARTLALAPAASASSGVPARTQEQAAAEAAPASAGARVAELRTLLRTAAAPDGLTSFVKCLRVSGDGISPAAPAPGRAGLLRSTWVFNWQAVSQACRSLGIIAEAQLQQNCARYLFRHIEFLAAYPELAMVSSVAPIFGGDLRELVAAALRRQLPELMDSGDIKVEDSFVSLPRTCFEALEAKRPAAQTACGASADALQALVRGAAVASRLGGVGEQLVQIQARVRRRMEIAGSLARKRSERQFVGTMKLVQAAAMFKARKEAAVVLQTQLRMARDAHLHGRVVLRKTLSDAYRREMQRRAARAELLELRDTKTAREAIAGALLALRERGRLLQHIADKSALSLQTSRRQKVAKQEVQWRRGATQARLALAGAIKAVSMRCALSRSRAEAAAITLQRARRNVIFKREAQDFAATAKARSIVLGVFDAVRWRIKTAEREHQLAAVRIQRISRGGLARKTVKQTRAVSTAESTVLGMLQSTMWRLRLKAFMAQAAALVVQRMWRGRTGRVRVANLRTLRAHWATVSRALGALALRQELKQQRMLSSVRTLEGFQSFRMRNRRAQHEDVKNLQDQLLGALNRLRAKRVLHSLSLKELRTSQAEWWNGFGQALLWRTKFAREREERAAIKMQDFVRWFIGKRVTKRFREIIAVARISAQSQVFAARRLMRKLGGADANVRARELWQHHLDVALFRLHFSYVMKRDKALHVIQRVARGYIGRKRFRLCRWVKAASRAVKDIRSVWKKYSTQVVMQKINRDAEVYQASAKLAFVVRTLQWRVATEHASMEHQQTKAQTAIAKFVRARNVRRRPEIKAIVQQLSLVKKEFQDRGRFEKMHAMMVMQKMWRSQMDKRKIILPKVVERLARERREFLRAHDRESSELPGFNTSRPWTTSGSHIADITFMNSTVADVCGWNEALSTIQRKGGTIIDIVLGAEHGFAVCATGHSFFFSAERSNPHKMRVGEPVQITFHDRFPGTHYSVSLQEMPRFTRVACGIGHVLFLSDQGLVYCWGLNSSGQCGVLEDHKRFDIVPEIMCVHPWSLPVSNMKEPEIGHNGDIGMPRVRSITCGPNASAAIDLNGTLWMWGNEQGLGLPLLRSAQPLSQKERALSKVHTPFLLFRYVRELHENRLEGKKYAPRAWQRNNAQDTIGTLERRDWFPAMGVPVAGEGTFEATKAPLPQLLGKHGIIRGVEESEMAPDRSRLDISTAMRTQTLTIEAMLENALADAPLERIAGDRRIPTICGELLAGQDTNMKMRKTGFIVRFSADKIGRSAVVMHARGRFSPFAEAFLSAKVNLVKCDNSFIYSWGEASAPMLGRGRVVERFDPAQLMAPARLATFSRMSTSVQTLAIGGRHVVALSCHGRVYTWGEHEACLDDSGFRIHSLREPTLVSGALESVRVTRVGAGRVDSYAAIEGVDTIQGWELLEASEDGKKIYPAIYQYTLTGPRFGPRSGETRNGRLTVAHSEYLEIFLVQDLSRGDGSSTVPPGAGRWGRDGEQGKKGPTGAGQLCLSGTVRSPSEFSPADRRRLHAARSPATALERNFNRGAGHALFEWAATSQAIRTQQSFEVPRKAAKLGHVGAEFSSKRREPLDLERELLTMRHLKKQRGIPTTHDEDALDFMRAV